jgi:excisionase family DNA binding protein
MPRPTKVPGPHVHWLSVQQAAFLAGLDRNTIKRLVKDGMLRTVKLPGGEWRRIPRTEVIALKRNLEQQLGEADGVLPAPRRTRLRLRP